MFLGMQGDYIVSVSENREELEAVKENFTSIEETDELVQRVGDKYIVGVENINEALKELRAIAYRQEVDTITAHIQRLRDEEEPDEEKIEELIEERAEKVDEIKERYPYQEEA